jgi:uncharacterized membrane protein
MPIDVQGGDIPWLSTDPITGTLAADSVQTIDVTFDTMTYTLGTYTGTLMVKTDDSVYDKIEIPVTMHIEAISYGVELAPAAAGLTGMPGEIVTYTLRITNTGNIPNSFDLAGSGNAWITALSESAVTLGGGESADFTVTVSVPADSNGGDSDMVTITATGAGDATASSVLTTEVGAVFSFDLVVEVDSLSGAPGDMVTYTVWMTNTSSITDSHDIAAGVHAWDMVMPAMAPMAPGEGYSMEIVVMIPADAGDGDSDTVTITVSSQGDPTVTAAITLTTEAVMSEYLIYLPLIFP